jgi:hypothetical protein
LDPWQVLTGFDRQVAEVVQLDRAPVFQAWIAAFLTRERDLLDPQGLSKLREMIALEHDNAWRPQFALLTRADGASGFEVANAITELRRVGVFDDVTSDGLFDRGDIWRSIIARARTEPTHEDVSVLPFFRVRELEDDQVSETLEVALRFRWETHFARNSDGYQAWMSYVASLLGRRGDRERFFAFLSAEVLAVDAAVSPTDEERIFLSLGEAVLNFASELAGTADERFSALLLGFNVLSRDWEAARANVRRTLSSLARHVPTGSSVDLGDMRLRLRAS